MRRGVSAKGLLVPFGESHQRMVVPEFQCQNSVSEVMPINDQACLSEETHEGGDRQSGNGGRVL